MFIYIYMCGRDLSVLFGAPDFYITCRNTHIYIYIYIRVCVCETLLRYLAVSLRSPLGPSFKVRHLKTDQLADRFV